MRKHFVPLSVRMGEREPFRPTTGVPGYMRPETDGWLSGIEQRADYDDLKKLARRLANRVRIKLAPQDVIRDGPWQALHKAITLDEVLYLDVLDALLGSIDNGQLEAELESILWDAGHEYRVDEHNHRLVQRVDDSVYAAYDKACLPQDEASDLIQEAWLYTYGRSEVRDPGTAWDKATAAVEAIYAPVITPNDKKSTLGKLRACLLDSHDKWVCDLPTDDPVKSLHAAMGVVSYRSNRHGGTGEKTLPEQSRAAVLQAVTLVAWGRDGVLRLAGA